MDKDGRNEGGKNKLKKTIDIGGITVEVDNANEGVLPSPSELEKQLRDGGIEVVEGKKSPEENDLIS